MTRVFALACALAACGSGTKPPPDAAKQPATAQPTAQPASKAAASIGVATMLDDGTLQLQLRAEGADGTIGDALLVYGPTHAQYQEILKHLGGMKPGDSKPVPPFPEK